MNNWEAEIKEAIDPTPQLETEQPMQQPIEIENVPNTIDNIGLLLALSDTPNYGTEQA